MRRGTVIALTIVGVVVGLILIGVAACVGLGWLWLERNAASIGDLGARALAEGQSFGSGHTTEECVEQGLGRGAACATSDPWCRANASIFLRACLQVASRPPGFCDGVPRPLDVMAAGRWAMEYCAARGRARDQACLGMVSEIQVHCFMPSTDPRPMSTGPGASTPAPAAPAVIPSPFTDQAQQPDEAPQTQP
jgi:hypothetical protein